MANEDYKNNPLYTDITNLDSLSPTPTFSYNWNPESGRWEPAGQISIENVEIDISGDLKIDLGPTNDILNVISSKHTEANTLLEGISGELSNIHLDVSIDSDEQSHKLLSGIDLRLVDINENLSGIQIDVSIDSDQYTHQLLSGISGELSNLDTEDIETHRLLSGISGELSDLKVESGDLEAHKILSGISGELANLEVDVEVEVDFSETNKLLSAISGELSSLDVDDTETHRLLLGISGELSNLDVDDTETHRLLAGISGELSNLESDDAQTHKLLSGISGTLDQIHIDVEIDEDTKSHELLSGVISSIDNIEIDPSKGSDRLLSGISGELSNISDDLIGISGELVDIYEQIERRELYQPWKLRTKTVSQKIEEDFLLMEDIPEDLRYGNVIGECFGQDKNLMEDVFGTYFRNSRRNKSEQETGHPDYFIHAEYTDPNRCIDSFATFHTDTLYGIRQENVSASLINSYELEDYNNLYQRGLVDHIILYNESPYPIQFHTAERRLNNSEPVSPETEDIIYLDTDMAVRIDGDEAGRIYVKRPHTISGYTIKYSIVYKETGLYDTIE